ncbi:anhydro-N-acetylmuramic acid kinase [Neisseriaceae bacterium ESL0693]|nr:anhydro-N-acetylmuramic acid kinase [Neisseriaceae bacterium ESL0693]
MQNNDYYIGLMSGTSMDGVDAVLAQFDQTAWQGAVAHTFVAYPSALRQALLQLQNVQSNELAQSALLAQQLARLNAQAIIQLLQQTGLNAGHIKAIGCHGQTIRHAPQSGYSIQLMDWALLAELTQITTVGHFRERDLAAGGQGAPLVPAFHQAVFADNTQTRVVLNLGGIANISILPPDQPAWGFDTGPANMLMDAWVQQHWACAYDDQGLLAASGRILPLLLDNLLAEPYFARPYPKSTGRELFNLSWLRQHLNGQEAPADVLRTLLMLTARTATQAIISHAPQTQQVFVCGGGAQNGLLIETLYALLSAHQITLSDTTALQLPPQWVEAAAFAWLAACWCQKQAVDVHHATGARGARIAGCGYWV